MYALLKIFSPVFQVSEKISNIKFMIRIKKKIRRHQLMDDNCHPKHLILSPGDLLRHVGEGWRARWCLWLEVNDCSRGGKQLLGTSPLGGCRQHRHVPRVHLSKV